MSQATKLFVNTGLTYARMGISIVIGLVVARLAFRHLGEDLSGLYGLLFAAVAMIAFWGDALAVACERNIAFALAKHDDSGVQRVYSAAMLMALALSAVLVLASVLLGGVAVAAMRIEPALHAEAHLTIVLSAAMLSVMTINGVVRSILTAHQNFFSATILDLGEAFARLGLVVAMVLLPMRSIAVYAGALLLVCLVLAIAQIVVVRRLYAGPRLRVLRTDRPSLNSLLVYAAWESVTSLGSRVRYSGSQLLIGAARLPKSDNAAFNLGQTAASYVSTLGYAIRRAVSPAMVSLHAKGRSAQFTQLVASATKLPMLMALLGVVPLLLETEYLLHLWLGQPPEGAALIMRLLVILVAADDLIRGHQLALVAAGRPRVVAIAYCIAQVAALGLAAALMTLWTAQVWVIIACLILGSLVMSAVVVGGNAHATGVRTIAWLRGVLVPVTLVYASAFACALALRSITTVEPLRLGLVLVGTLIGASVVGWFVGLNRHERAHVLGFARKARARLARSA
jgi:O-antigen/teichoic acid export membrane protein